MSVQLPAPAPKQMATPTARDRPAEAREEFSPLVWNTLSNRAGAIIQALRTCRTGGTAEGPCEDCPIARVDAGNRPGSGAAGCRSGFRTLEQRLARLANLAPEPERQQLRRTVDSLHLAYRQLERKG